MVHANVYLLNFWRTGMPGTFWTNTVWYLLLLAASVTMLCVALVKSDNRRFTAAFFLAVTGLYYFFEFFLATVGEAYSYSPKIFPGDAFLETYMGNTFSQTAIASASVLIIVCKLKWPWYFIFAALFYLIELLFVRLGIYATHWYRSIYTFVILPPLFWAVCRWHGRITGSPGKSDDIPLVFFGSAPILANAVMFPLRLMGIVMFTGGFFSDPSRDHTTSGFFCMVIFLGVMTSVCRPGWRWPWKAAAFAGLFCTQYVLWITGFMQIKSGWFIWATAYEIVVLYLCMCLVGWLAVERKKRA